MDNKIYIAIDLKSFYASYECSERKLDPLTTNLVVADISRTEKTICLAVSPSLKEYGLPGRARLFEVNQKIKEINQERLKIAKKFVGKSYDKIELQKNPNLELDIIVATPQMRKYIECSSLIYSIYLKYVSKEDIHVYSIDEVFIDATDYLKIYKMTPYEFTSMLIKEVFKATNITATGGIGTNLYLAKVAMDILAKHEKPNTDGVRIAYLDERLYRERLWDHKPLTDFWRIGHGLARRLESHLMFTMGDVCRYSLKHEEKLYDIFGINAELIIDHAWGIEPVTIKDIKSYKPKNTSISQGQVLSCGYNYDKALLIVKEMTDNLCLDLVADGLLTRAIGLNIGYDSIDNYDGTLVNNYYGKLVPKPANSMKNLMNPTSSSRIIIKEMEKLYKEIVDKNLLIKRINIAFAGLIFENQIDLVDKGYKQLNLFEAPKEESKVDEESEHRLQKVIVDLKEKYGKNSVLKGMNLEEDSTAIERNEQIGGHKA